MPGRGEFHQTSESFLQDFSLNPLSELWHHSSDTHRILDASTWLSACPSLHICSLIVPFFNDTERASQQQGEQVTLLNCLGASALPDC